jgi:hypothetical protein
MHRHEVFRRRPPACRLPRSLSLRPAGAKKLSKRLLVSACSRSLDAGPASLASSVFGLLTRRHPCDGVSISRCRDYVPKSAALRGTVHPPVGVGARSNVGGQSDDRPTWYVSILLAGVLDRSGTVGPYATALIAAGGVLVGGIITALSNLVIERQRRKQVDEARDAENSRELRQAVRIVLEQLSANSRSMLEAASQGAPWDGSTPLRTGAWLEHQTILAGYLSDEAWRWGSSVSNSLAELGAKTSDVGSISLEQLREVWVTVEHAMSILESEMVRRTGAFRGGVYQYTGYAGANEKWPPGGLPGQTSLRIDDSPHHPEEVEE